MCSSSGLSQWLQASTACPKLLSMCSWGLHSDRCLCLLRRRTNWKSKGKKKKKGASDKVDLYALLGLQNERWTATEGQIKNGARDAAASMALALQAEAAVQRKGGEWVGLSTGQSGRLDQAPATRAWRSLAVASDPQAAQARVAVPLSQQAPPTCLVANTPALRQEREKERARPDVRARARGQATGARRWSTTPTRPARRRRARRRRRPSRSASRRFRRRMRRCRTPRAGASSTPRTTLTTRCPSTARPRTSSRCPAAARCRPRF